MNILQRMHTETAKLYYFLKDQKTGEVHPDFKAHLESFGLNAEINNIRFGLTQQQSSSGALRNIGVYVQGDNIYDADMDGSASFAVIVDFLLRNGDSGSYLKYGDCLISYLNSLPIGFHCWVQNASTSLASSDSNNRVTALVIVMLEPVTDSSHW